MDIDLDEIKRKSDMCRLVSAGFQVIIGPDPHDGLCPNCELSKPDIANRRLNTQYTADESNWLESCLDCYQERVDYYNELWADYQSSQGF